MKLFTLLYLLLSVAFCSFAQDDFALYDENKEAVTLYFKDGRTFAIANKPYEAYPFQWWNKGPEQDGYFNIRNVRYGKCLYYDARSRTVEATTCQETEVQKWKIEDGVLINKYSKLGLKMYDEGNVSVKKEEATVYTVMPLKEINNAPVKITAKQENLGENINTIYPEVIPVISGDGNQLFFMRKELTADKKITSNIYVSKKVSPTRWAEAVKMPAPLNNERRNYVCSASSNGETLLLGNQYHEDGSVSQGISITHYKNGKWTFPEPVQIEGFNNYSSKAEYSLSYDDQILLMAVESDESIGQRDLFVSFRKEDGTFSKPLNLGPTLNTPFQEDAPFLSADKKTLYFSSNGLPGYGRHDIFMATRMGDTWTDWSEPVNLGRPINSADWEAYFSIDSQLDYAYVVAENDKCIGRSDIFRIKLPEGFVSDPAFLLKGKVLDDETGEPIQLSVKVYEVDTDEKEVNLTAEKNAFEAYLAYDKTYAVFVEAEGYVPYIDRMKIEERTISVLEREFRLKRMTDIGESVIVIKNVLFDTDKITWTPSGKRELDMMVNILKDVPEVSLEVRGHTDNVGNSDYNQKLSEGRAKAVYDYFITQGISKKRLNYKGFGETTPIASNDTEEGRAKNRRVEFFITKKD